ncbi:hypothetical protein E2C01_069905 [Portunus trituberculatus]|uniref:Uncharacterized protein n=1 Tax=Portunus trituberculatus TaxID=210409 RepID=A0A5B7I413_PORTR|nr:hypothetical protein [Portunus trituberculatus]
MKAYKALERITSDAATTVAHRLLAHRHSTDYADFDCLSPDRPPSSLSRAPYCQEQWVMVRVVVVGCGCEVTGWRRRYMCDSHACLHYEEEVLECAIKIPFAPLTAADNHKKPYLGNRR